MSAAEVLEQARRQGVEVFAATGGKLGWRCRGPLPEGLRGLLAAHKDELLALLAAPVKVVNVNETPAKHGNPAGFVDAAAVPGWDQGEADRLLAELREAVARARQDFRAPFPADLQAVVADGVAIAVGYVANHEAEARRGWDALQLLRKVKRRLLATIKRVKTDREAPAS
jgi:hypothetical protein